MAYEYFTRPEYKEVSLGAYNKEDLRRMFYAGNVNDYPKLLQTYVGTDLAKDIIIPPRRGKLNNYTVYTATITGSFYLFHITKGKPIDVNIIENTLKPDGTMTILNTDKETAKNYLLYFSGAINSIQQSKILQQI